MNKSLQIAYPVCFSLIIIFLITSSIAVDLQKSFVPFTGERILRFSASTIQYDPELFGKVTPTEEEPPPGICIGSGGHPCICTNCKCCTSECPPCKSSPVLSGGVYQRIDTDFSLPGRGFSYDFSRHYYSSGKNIASLGIAWSSPLDTALIIVGEQRAYFQFEQTTVEFDGNRSANCADFYHTLNYSRKMLLKGVELADGCNYLLIDYDNERKYYFYKDQLLENSPYPLKGLLKKVCDYNGNCWLYKYKDWSDTGTIAPMIAPERVDNTSLDIEGNDAPNNVWAKFYYSPLEFPYPDTDSFIQLIDHIEDSNGRTWYYTYNVEVINAQQQHYMFVGAQRSLSPLGRGVDGKNWR